LADKPIPLVRDLDISQRAKFELTVQVNFGGVAKDLSGWTAKMMIREVRTDSAVVLDTFTSSPAHGLSIVGPAGQVLVDILGAWSAAWDWTAGEYDLYIYDPAASNEPYRIMQGKVKVSHSVTV
jgi:hypothetical protein